MMTILPDKYFKRVFLNVYVLHGSLLQLLLEHGDFLKEYISQGSISDTVKV